jgi:hypothetical protein
VVRAALHPLCLSVARTQIYPSEKPHSALKPDKGLLIMEIMKNIGHQLPAPTVQVLPSILHRAEVAALIREAIALLIETGELPRTHAGPRLRVSGRKAALERGDPKVSQEFTDPFSRRVKALAYCTPRASRIPSWQS